MNNQIPVRHKQLPTTGVAGLRVVVTAGAGGAGRIIAQTFADLGAKVLVCDIDAMAVADLESQRSDISAFVADVSIDRAVDELFGIAESRFGGVDVLVNNVGVAGPTAPVERISTDEWQTTLAANLTSHFMCVRRVVPGMKSQGSGLIVNISSGSAKVGLPLRLPYVVSKGAGISMTMNLARELGPHGIRVNAILPGPIRGKRIERVIREKALALQVSPQEYERSLLQFISLRTMVDPEDIAAMIVFLASSAGQRITGQAIGVDGNIEYEA
jgi:NAD(P)-dependent dehydrogenase (short-subunit alcohol dehydrogenase family)